MKESFILIAISKKEIVHFKIIGYWTEGERGKHRNRWTRERQVDKVERARDTGYRTEDTGCF